MFVEFTDPAVRAVLQSLRQSLSPTPVLDTAHITVRGPYGKKPDKKLVDRLSEKLNGQGVLVADVGMFETGKGYAVFLHAVSKIFDEIWWKPDFDGPDTKRTPHVTIFETARRTDALAVRQFLSAEGLEIFTFGVALTVYTSKQHTLLAEDEHLVPDRKTFPQERLIAKSGILDRAVELRNHLNGSGEAAAFQQMLI